MPTISIIVPVYRVEKYIRRCVDSILAQSFRDYELILVDDGSPDCSGAICDEYAARDPRIRVIHKKNGGLSSARNAGIDVSSGEYLFFMDSDDVIHHHCLEALWASLYKENADISIGKFCRFDCSCLPTQEHMSSEIVAKTQYFSGIEAINFCLNPDFLISRYWISACCKLIKKELFKDVRFPIGKLFEDEHITYLLYSKAKKIVLVDYEMYFYFINNEGITGSLTLNKQLDHYDAQWERIQFLQEQGEIELHKKAVLLYLYNAQWDMIKLNNGFQDVNKQKAKLFIHRYRRIRKIATSQKWINLIDNLDYYVCAHPHAVLLYRFLRIMRKYIWIAKKEVW